MVTTYFYITPEMRQLFNNCAEKKDYKEFYNFYKWHVKELSDKLEAVKLPKNFLVTYIVHNFAECFDHLILPPYQIYLKSYVSDFYKDVHWAITNKNWERFYRKYRDCVDYVMRQANEQRIVNIYVVDKNINFTSFFDRDCYSGYEDPLERCKTTSIYCSKNDRSTLKCPSLTEKTIDEFQDICKQANISTVTSNSAYSVEHNQLTTRCMKCIQHSLDRFPYENKREERADRRRKLEEELRKLDLEDREELVMVSNIKTPKQESPPTSPPPLNHDVIENDSLDHVLQNTLRSTDTESSEEHSDQEAKERDEVNFNTLLQEQALRQQEEMEKMKKNKAEVLNRTCATLETSGLVALKPHAGEVEHQPTVLKNQDQENKEKFSTGNMKTEQIAAGESSERLPIFSKLLSDLDPIPVPLPKSEKTPCLEDLQLYMENIVKQTTESMADVTAAEELIKNDLKNAETSESKLPAIEQHDSEGEEKEAQERLNRSVQTQSIRQQEEFEVKRKEWADRKKKLEEDTDSIRKRGQERLISFLNGLKK